jgi:hypothetical protein
MTSSDPTMTASQIAELAGVSRSAVSNWRRRQRDFPRAVGTAPGGGDLFVVADVERWLERHQGRRTRIDPAQAIWLAADAARGRLPTERALEVAADALALAEVVARRDVAELARLRELPDDELMDALQAAGEGPTVNGVAASDIAQQLARAPRAESIPIVRHALAVETTAERVRAFEYLLQAGKRALGRRGGESASSVELARLLVDLAQPSKGTIFDPAAGEGTFLLLAAEHAKRRVRILGQERNVSVRRLACERLYLHGIEADIELRDSFAGPAPFAVADLVLCDPPYGLQLSDALFGADDPRWFAGPPGRNGDLAWLQMAVLAVRPSTGRAYVTTPLGATFRGGRERAIRTELLRRGMVEAVIGLPPGLASTTSIPLVVWVLRHPEGERAEEPVLFVDAAAGFREGAAGLAEPTHRLVVQTLARFRGEPRRFAAVPGLARAVPVLELLGPDTSLSPSRWVGAIDGEAIVETIRLYWARASEAKRRLEAGAFPAVEVHPLDEERVPLRVRDLIKAGRLELLRGARIGEVRLSKTGIPLVGAPEVRLREPRQRYIPATALPERVEITRPGDVLIAPISNPPKALIETEGGRVLAAPLVALRSLGGGPPPQVLAAAVSSEHNVRNVGGAAIPHVRVQDLELPRLSQEAGERTARLLAALDDQIASAEALAQEARALRAALSDGLAADRIDAAPAEAAGGQ